MRCFFICFMNNKKGKNIEIKIRRPVYAGVSINKGGFYIAIQDGKKIAIEYVKAEKSKINKKIFSWLYNFALKNYAKVISVGITGDNNIDKLTSDLWLKQDIVPYVFDIKNQTEKNKAKTVLLETTKNFNRRNLVKTKISPRRRVRTVRLANLSCFKKSVSKENFNLLLELAKKFQNQENRMVFFSSTVRGGGVALMRHALIRLYRLFGISVDWHVMTSKNEVFKITKKKFHNILQGVNSSNIKFTNQDKKIIKKWTEKNVKKFSSIIKNSKVIVIDDPQPSSMIPYIKEINPEAKIIYRSHIQLETDLIKQNNTLQNYVWNFLWENIKYSDLFIAHPIKGFIPYTVPKEKVVLMGAATDKFDGLNKIISVKEAKYYFDIFNEILINKGESILDLKRPYIIQIARFDPSKGIFDVIEAYAEFRKKIACKKLEKDIPQLVITGNGAIDDPEATSIYCQIINFLQESRFKDFVNDIKVVRLPYIDQLLNVLLRYSFVVLQLSHKEGFEIKVSEALEKNKPVIAYKTGGIPLQIEHNITGYLAETGDTKKVADYLYKLAFDKKEYLKISKNAKEKVSNDCFTVVNAIKWLFLATELIEKGKIKGNRKYARDIIKKQKKVDLS